MPNIQVGYQTGGYAFDASAQTITFTGLGTVQAEQIRLITNVTDGVIIYNFASATNKGSLTSNVLTLDYDTTTMSDTDVLQIDLAYSEAIDYNLDVQKTIPQANSPIVSNDYESLISASTAIASSISTWTNQGSEIDVRGSDEISFIMTHTHTSSTAVAFRIQCSDENGGTYYAPMDTSYSVAIGDATGTKEIGFDVKRFNYIRLQGCVETDITDTIIIDLAKTINS